MLETDRHRIVGDLTLPGDGYRSRFSDYLNREDVSFIPLVNVEVDSMNGADAPEKHPFMAIGRTHILRAYPYADDS